MANGPLIGMIYEGIILIPAITFIIVALLNYLNNKRYLSLMLFLILLNYGVSIVFSFFSKILSVFFYTDYLEIDEVTVPNSILAWLLVRISYFRFTFMFINLAILFSYLFRKDLFHELSKPILNYLIFAFCGFNLFYSLCIFAKNFILLDLLLFLFTFLFQCLVYIPFFQHSLKSFKTLSNSSFKRNYLLLMIMSLSFIAVLLCILLDRFLIFLGTSGYSLFYFISWIFVIFGIFSAYFGYFRLEN